MYTLMIGIFILGYAAITLEHNLKIDKAAAALLTGVICWTLYVFGAYDLISFSWLDQAVMGKVPDLSLLSSHDVEEQILENLSEIASILFFLIGAMTIVELIDAHEGFSVITNRIKTTNKVKLLWIVGLISFFFSAALDNLTTSIVMISVLRKLISDRKNRWLYASLVIIASNAGGAWSPIGDVTTTMLWIGGQITTEEIVYKVFLPSLVCLLVPLIILSFRTKGHVRRPRRLSMRRDDKSETTTPYERKFILISGLLGLLFVPIHKSVTHLPPFMGMMFSLGVLWLITDLLHRRKKEELRMRHSVIGVLRKIDTPSVLFFLGILLAVGSLQSAGQLGQLASLLDNTIGTSDEQGIFIVGGVIGLLSSVVDNVPLVAASMGMYPIDAAGYFMQDGLFWEYLAYCAGTGGSALIIGSAAGVAVMGLEKITFGWYFRKMSWLAIIGYLSGVVVYIVRHLI